MTKIALEDEPTMLFCYLNAITEEKIEISLLVYVFKNNLEENKWNKAN